MRSGHFVSLVAAALFGSFTFAIGGCAGVHSNPTGVDGGGGAGGIHIDGGRVDIPAIESGNPALCGNGMQDPGEQCDDGNKTAGDGCSVICQIPAGWSCTGWPSHCNMEG